jgi:alpha-D-xyloside xylohydrolase
VFDPDGHVDVYLPPGTWVDYWSGDTHDGGQTLSLQVDLEEMPVFLRAGTITPRTDPVDPIPERAFEDVTLRVVLDRGATDAVFEYADGDVAGTISARTDKDNEVLAFVFDAEEGCSLSADRFDATVENTDGTPDTVTVEDGAAGDTQPLEAVDADPDAGEWTVADDGSLTVRF